MEGVIGGILAFLGILLIIPCICYIVWVVGVWKTFTKAGKPGWAAIVPIYFNIVILEIIGQPITRFWWYLIPFYGLYLVIVDFNDLCKSFGKDSGFTAGLILLPPVFWCILGFGDARYLGPTAGHQQVHAPQPGYPQQQQPPQADQPPQGGPPPA